MRKFTLLPLAALAACTASAGGQVEATPAEEAAFSAAIAGRTAGAPVACVRQRDLRNTRAAGPDTLLFDGPGGIVYVNRTKSSCPRIRPWHAILHRTSQTAMCTNELIRVFEPQSGIEFGGCTLGEFTPYRRGD
jgi:hypothetical protein